MNNVIEKGKELAWLLRHDSESYNKGLIDHAGWRYIDEIVKNYDYDYDLIDEIVKTNNKQRYEYNSNKTKIRARQGHSIHVDVEMKEATNIDEEHPYLYHGTSNRFIEQIKEQGLLPQSRIYVHLTDNENTAFTVGKRHGGKVCIITINAWKMKQDGIPIYISNNGVYNTAKVDKKYFVNIELKV